MVTIDNRRIRQLNNFNIESKGPILYWMSRDQRAVDNWALIFAQKLAIEQKRPFCVVFCLADSFLGANIRHYLFMLKGLKETSENLNKKDIPLQIIIGNPNDTLPLFIEKNNISAIISDFDPLRIKREWKNKILEKIKIPFYEVDAHNIVPSWIASNKKEFSARTFRIKINKFLSEFLTDYPELICHPFNSNIKKLELEIEKIIHRLKIDKTVPEVNNILPGEKNALKTLKKFLREKIEQYPDGRNNPNFDNLSNLSPYLHFGQISAQRTALEVLGCDCSKKAKDVFLEELIVRRELSDNFCYYEDNYDNFYGFPEWAQETLNKHKKDKRVYLYTLEDFEKGNTHDKLWNSAQMEMVLKGKMHGYLRMYWAKKILEWSESPEMAIKTAIYLNDKYELDGRDPNGYTGIAWSIGGVHDRPWQERDIFGKIRYMSYNGCQRKFDIEKYIKNIQALL